MVKCLNSANGQIEQYSMEFESCLSPPPPQKKKKKKPNKQTNKQYTLP